MKYSKNIIFIFYILYFFSCKETNKKNTTYPKEIIDLKMEKLFDDAKWNVYNNCYRDKFFDSLGNTCTCFTKDLKYLNFVRKGDTIQFNFIIPLKSKKAPTFYTIGISNQNLIYYIIVGDGIRINNYTYYDYIKSPNKFPWVTAEFEDTLKKYPLYFQTDSPYFINTLISSKSNLCTWIYNKSLEKGYF